jgi:hypothetical protein
METIKCKHDFRDVIVKKQEWKKNYTKDSKYDYQTLVQEEVYIYCNKCGEHKRVDDNIILLEA